MSKSNYQINKEQREHLGGRISLLMHKSNHIVAPPSVVAARKVVSAFEKRQRAEDGKLREAWVAHPEAAREAVAFKSADEALAAVKRLEADAAKNRERDDGGCAC